MIDKDTMRSLVEAAETFDREGARRFNQAAESERAALVERFPLDRWVDMPLERYALGQGTSEESFCWWMEFGTKALGSIRGGAAGKHLVFRRRDGSWRYPVSYGSVEEAWDAVRAGFVECFSLAAEGRFDDITSVEALKGAPALRAKSLFVLLPRRLPPRVHQSAPRPLPPAAGGPS